MSEQDGVAVLKMTMVDLSHMTAYEALRRIVAVCGRDAVLAAIESEMSPCTHSTKITHRGKTVCMDCGARIAR